MLSSIRRYLELALEGASVLLTDEDKKDLLALDASVLDWDDNLHRIDALERRMGVLEEKLRMPQPRDPALRTG